MSFPYGYPAERGQSHKKTSAPSNRPLYDWTAQIQADQYELGSSYSVIIFLGHVPDNPRDWEISPNYVGSHYAPVESVPEGGERRRDKGVIIEGFVHLNHAIAKHSGLHSFEPDVVVPYLTKNLDWRVLKSNGQPAKLKSLEVTVHATPLSFPPGTTLPVPGKSHRYDSITYGRDGGSCHAPSL
jgi:tyrosinase